MFNGETTNAFATMATEMLNCWTKQHLSIFKTVVTLRAIPNTKKDWCLCYVQLNYEKNSDTEVICVLCCDF